MFDHLKYNFFQFVAKLSIFTLLIAFFAYFSVDTLQLLSNSGNQYAIEIYEYDGGEEEKNNESEDEVKEIDDFLFASAANKSNNNLLFAGKIRFQHLSKFQKRGRISTTCSVVLFLTKNISFFL